MAAAFVPLDKLLGETPRALDVLLRRNEEIVCRHTQTKKTKRVLLRALHDHNRTFWATDSAWAYYVAKDVAAGLLERPREGDVPPESQPASEPTEPESQPNFGAEYQRIASLPVAKRAELLATHAWRLTGLGADPAAFLGQKVEALVESSRDAAMVNKVTLDEAAGMERTQAAQHTRSVVSSTTKMVRAAADLDLEDVAKDELFAELVQKSSGAVVQHMTRVFVTGLALLRYYNDRASRANLATRIRVKFQKKYRDYYRQLLPHLAEEQITLERVFLGGVRALTDDEVHHFALGFLVHDVGKIPDIEYHEGEEEYDRGKVVQHVRTGYRAVTERTEYPREAALITGYHHEYYNDPGGYGYFRAFLAKYREANPRATIDYAIAYDMEEVIDYRALSFFPAKLLEIVDVYDSLTDPTRRYRSALSQHDAIKTMSEEFIQRSRRLDPILFDVFAMFVYGQAADEV